MLRNRIDVNLPVSTGKIPFLQLIIAQIETTDLTIARAHCDELVDEVGHRDGDIRFSRSHCRDWIAVAAASGLDIGVDIELARTRQRWKEIADFINLGASNNDEFWQRWTLREAIAKCVGGSVLVKEEIETSLSGALPAAGEWFLADGAAALCDQLDVGIYYSLVVNGLPESDHIRCA